MEAQEFKLQTRLGAFAGLNWEQPGAANILCLHGWLDNAASFLPLAPHLDRFNLVAVDFAGHGNSCHRAPGARYHMLDNLWDIDAILDALEWDNCILLGHSLGGAVGCTYAAADPARVTNLITLDGLGPLSSAPGDAIRRLRNALGSIRKARQ